MASAERSLPSCPVCKRADQVKTAQGAYNAGVARCAPPDMPTRSVSMVPYMLTGAVIVGICIFLIVVLIGSGGAVRMGPGFMLGLVGVTIVCILAALIISFLAFQRVVRGDAETTLRFPAWDRAMEAWRNLYYCSRDDVVFDGRTQRTLTNEQLNNLRHASERAEAVQSRSAIAH